MDLWRSLSGCPVGLWRLRCDKHPANQTRQARCCRGRHHNHFFHLHHHGARGLRRGVVQNSYLGPTLYIFSRVEAPDYRLAVHSVERFNQPQLYKQQQQQQQ